MRQALFLSLLALAACAAPQGIRTTGDLRLQAVQPALRGDAAHACIAGDHQHLFDLVQPQHAGAVRAGG